MPSHGEANTTSVSSVTIDSLPNVLLAAVFVIGREHSSKRHAHEMGVSHVSRRWRNVAVHTGALWTDIFITFRQSSQLISKGHALEFSVKSGLPYGRENVAVLTCGNRCAVPQCQ